MPQDLFTIKRYALELNNLLTGAKVNKITMPSKEEVILTLYGGKIFNVTLNASANFCRVGMTNLSKDNPLIAPNFCMLLRKHLTYAVVTSVSVLNDDRIVSLNFKNASEFNANENFSLICEVMGKYSNVFLVQNGTVLGSLKPAPQTLENKRVLLTKSKYDYPEKQPKLNAYDLESLKLCFKNYKGESLNKFILKNFYEFSPTSAKELEHLILAKNNGVFDSEIAVKVTSEFINKKTDATVITLNNVSQFFAFDYESVTGERKRFNSIIDAMFFAYLGLENNDFITQKQNALMQKVNALEKKLIKKQNVLLSNVKESENAEIYKLYGELLTAYAYLIKKGQKSASLINYYDNEKIEIQLDENLTAVENAQYYYKKYSKLKNTLIKTKPQLEKIEEELKYLDSVKLAISLAKSKLDFIDIEEELNQNSNIKSQKVVKKQPKKAEKSDYIRYEIDGFSVLVGKNNVQNDRLFKETSSLDIWFHVKNQASSHAYILTKNKQVSPSILLTVAEICAYYSKAKNEQKVEVDYTFKKHVKKQAGKNLGAVTYTDFKTLIVTPKVNENLKKMQ